MGAKSKQSNSDELYSNQINDIWCSIALDVICWDLFVSFTFFLKPYCHYFALQYNLLCSEDYKLYRMHRRIINKYIIKYGESHLAIGRGVTTPDIKVLDSDESKRPFVSCCDSKDFNTSPRKMTPLIFFIQMVSAIQILLVTISKADKITKNTRVLILKITQRSIRAQTLIDPVTSFLFPKIKFKFKLPYGNSFRL